MQLIEEWRTKRQIRETLIINRGGRPKITHFWSPNKRAYGKKRKRKRKKKKRKKAEQSKSMDLWNLSMEILKSCMDFSMILYKHSWVWVPRDFFGD